MGIWLWKCHRNVCLGTCFSKVLFVEILLTSLWTAGRCWCRVPSLSDEGEEAILWLWTVTGDTSTIQILLSSGGMVRIFLYYLLSLEPSLCITTYICMCSTLFRVLWRCGQAFTVRLRL